jgi:hypothetical protein
MTRAAAVVFVECYTALDSIGTVFVGWLLELAFGCITAAIRPAI